MVEHTAPFQHSSNEHQGTTINDRSLRERERQKQGKRRWGSPQQTCPIVQIDHTTLWGPGGIKLVTDDKTESWRDCLSYSRSARQSVTATGQRPRFADSRPGVLPDHRPLHRWSGGLLHLGVKSPGFQVPFYSPLAIQQQREVSTMTNRRKCSTFKEALTVQYQVIMAIQEIGPRPSNFSSWKSDFVKNLPAF